MRSQTLLRAILTLLVVYFSTFGMTFNGILIPELRWMTLAIVLVGLSTWFITHYRAKWIWHRSPLDVALILWMVVIGVSILANMETWRRSANGVWFVVGYVLLWYMLSDWLMNNRLQRETLIDSVIMGGIVIVFFGYLQFLTALGRGEIARVGSLVGNPNSLGAFLLMLLTFIAGRIFTLKNRIGRRLLIVYALITTILLGIAFSRGALAGGAISIIILIALNLPLDFWNRIKPQTARLRLMWALGGLFALLIAVGVIFITVRSFNLAGRSADLRIDIYTDALTIFSDSPITGHGLFTFGREFALQQSQPPQQPHSHAHNGVLLVMAELGLMGLAILMLTVITVFAMMRHNWLNSDNLQRRFLAIGIAGSIGFGVHHLLDFPAMMPLIALTGLIPIALAIIPYQPKPLQARFRIIGHPI
ncbi:MAG: O-antigen ligase family protein, partial [Anaerolineae bacterium]|nr:O-antigen ligase family protein [Anaerolineae bacterium]